MSSSQIFKSLHSKRERLKFFDKLPINDVELSVLLLLNKISYRAASLKRIKNEIKEKQDVYDIVFTLEKKKLIKKIESKIDQKGFYFLLTLDGINTIDRYIREQKNNSN